MSFGIYSMYQVIQASLKWFISGCHEILRVLSTFKLLTNHPPTLGMYFKPVAGFVFLYACGVQFSINFNLPKTNGNIANFSINFVGAELGN